MTETRALPRVSEDLVWVPVPGLPGEKRWELAWAEPRADQPLVDDADFVGDS